MSPGFVGVRVRDHRTGNRCKGYVLILSLSIGSIFVYVLTLFLSFVRYATQLITVTVPAQLDESDYIDSCQEPWMR